MEHKMKKKSEKNTKCLVLGALFAQIQAKVNFLQILDCQFLGVQKCNFIIDHICLLNILLMYTFELIWPCLAMLDQVQLICDSLTKQ